LKNASGLFNLTRNLGGAVGLAVLMRRPVPAAASAAAH
jgi:hypothetical protein